MYFSTTFITAITTGLGSDVMSVAVENKPVESKFPIQRQAYRCLHCGQQLDWKRRRDSCTEKDKEHDSHSDVDSHM